jgi:hypothetical protein
MNVWIRSHIFDPVNLPRKQSAVPPQAHDQTAAAQSHDQHHVDVDKRGDEVMAFDHEDHSSLYVAA